MNTDFDFNFVALGNLIESLKLEYILTGEMCSCRLITSLDEITSPSHAMPSQTVISISQVGSVWSKNVKITKLEGTIYVYVQSLVSAIVVVIQNSKTKLTAGINT